MPTATVLCEAIDLKQYEWPVPPEDEDCWFIVNPEKNKWKSIEKTKPAFSKDKPLHFAFVNTSSSIEYVDTFFKNLQDFIEDHSDRLKSVVLHFTRMFPCHPTKKVTKSSFLDWEWSTNGLKFDKLEYLYLGDPKYKITKQNKDQISRFMPYDLKKLKTACRMAATLANTAATNAKMASAEVISEDGAIATSLVAHMASKIFAEEIAQSAKLASTTRKLAAENIKQTSKEIERAKKAQKEYGDLVGDLDVLKVKRSKFEEEAKKKADIYSKIADTFRGKEISSDLVFKNTSRMGKEKKQRLLFLAKEMISKKVEEVAAEIDAEMAAKQNFLNLKHLALLGVDSEQSMHKILVYAIESNGKQDIDCIMHVRYSKKSKTVPCIGTPYRILQRFSYFSEDGEYQRKKPREYEYSLMAKLAYSLRKKTNGMWLKGLKVRKGVFGIQALLVAGEEEEIPEEMPDYFWLTMRGWRLATFIHESFSKGSNYTGAILVNKYTHQIVLATRGTAVDFKNEDLGAVTSDLKGVFLGRESGQQVAARNFLRNLLGDVEGTSTKRILDKSIFGKIQVVPRCKPGYYNSIREEEEEGLSRFNLSFTGHSLGAWLSEVLVAEACLEGYYASSVTFDSPGAGPMIAKLLQCKTTQLDCVGFVGSPNFVNTCNEHVGEIRSILNSTPSAISSLQSLGNDILEWFASSMSFHSANNFVSAGSRFQKDLVAAQHVGKWPVSLKISLRNAISYLVALCKGHYTYLINTGLQHFRNRLLLREKIPLCADEWQKSCEEIKSVSKDNLFPLELRDYYSFLLTRLHPHIQQLVEIYTSFSNHIRSEISQRILPEFSTLMEPIKDLTRNGFVTLKREENQILPLKLITKLNSFPHAQMVVTNHKEQILTKVSIEDQINSFIQYLFGLLASPQSLAASLPPSDDKVIPNGFKGEGEGEEEEEEEEERMEEGEEEFASIEALQKYVLRPEEQGAISGKEQQIFISRHFNRILKKSVEKARDKVGGREAFQDEEFAIIAFGSWGRDCPLPDGKPKQIWVITKSDPKEGSSAAVAEFCEELEAECTKAGISCQDNMIPFGSKEEILRRYVLGPHASTAKEYPPKEKKDINGCLLRLCAIWDSSCVYGNNELVEQFKDLFEGIMDPTDENGFRRDRQFLKCFFHYIQSKVQSKKEVTKDQSKGQHTGQSTGQSMGQPTGQPRGEPKEEEEEGEEYTMEEVRSVYLDLFNIITFLSLFDRVRATNPWERMQDIIRKGTVSERLGSQLLCYWNVVHKLYLQGTNPCETGVKESMENDELYKLRKKIFFFVKTTCIKTMGAKCSTFLTSLDSFSKGKNPFYENMPDSQVAMYYAFQAKNSQLSMKTADLWDQAYLHEPTKEMAVDWPNPQEYRESLEEFEKTFASTPAQDIPLSPAGVRPRAIEEQKNFVNYLKSISLDTKVTGAVPYTYNGQNNSLIMQGILNPSVSSVINDIPEEDRDFKECSVPVSAAVLGSDENVYRCYFLSFHLAVLATHSYLSNLISGRAVPSYLLILPNPDEKKYAIGFLLFIKETGEQNEASLAFKEALSVPLQIQYSLQFLENLVLQQDTNEKKDIVWPSQTGEMDPYAFCSTKILASPSYSYTHSALIDHPQFELVCRPEAIRIFLYLSPFEILNAWARHTACYTNQKVRHLYNRRQKRELDPLFVLALYDRFLFVQTIVRQNLKLDSSLSHADILGKMPDIFLKKGANGISTYEFCLPSRLERSFYDSCTTYDIPLIMSYAQQMQVIEDNAKRDKRCTVETFPDHYHWAQLVYHLSFKYLLKFQKPLKNQWEENQLWDSLDFGHFRAHGKQLRILDFSNSVIKEAWLRPEGIIKEGGSPLQRLLLDNTKFSSFASTHFHDLVTLSLEGCINLTKAILNVDEMPYLQSVSFNDSTSFTSLKVSGNHKKRKFPLHISLLRTSISADIKSKALKLPREVMVFKNNVLQNEKNIKPEIPPVYLQVSGNAQDKP